VPTIEEFQSISSLASNDLVPVVDISEDVTKKATIAQLVAGLTPPGSDGDLVTNTAGAFGNLTPPAGSLVGTTSTQTLTNKTLTSPILGGTPQYTSARGSVRSVVGEVQTSSTSQTTVASYAMTDETLCAFDVIVTCARRTNVTKGGRWKRSVVYRRTSAAAPAIVGTLETGTDQETTAGDDVTVDVSGSSIVVLVTAADADARNWLCELRVQETLAT
jgi:hypothetical protein